MATTHALSVITNSCVKSPVNPKSGLVSTTNERPNTTLGFMWNDRKIDDTINQKSYSRLQHSVNFDTANTFDNITANLSGLTDDEFYQKLTELKKEHRKTLTLCEKMYNEKLASQKISAYEGRRNTTASSFEYANSQDCAQSQQPINTQGQTFCNSIDVLRDSFTAPHDQIKDMSAAKPPTGRPKRSEGNEMLNSSEFNSKFKSNGESISEQKPNKQAWVDKSGISNSFDSDFWKPVSTNSSDGELNEDEHPGLNTIEQGSKSPLVKDSKLTSMNYIEDMWENFSVDEYVPQRRERSSSMSRLQEKSKNKANKDISKWRHRITIPEPFSMTTREANKEKRKSRCVAEMEQERRELEQLTESECQKKFKASPVPAHIYLPRYDEIMEEKESRRRYIKEYSKAMLKASEKPFNFLKRDGEKTKTSRSLDSPLLEKEGNKSKHHFKANPFPAHIFDSNIDEKIEEEEEYRKIKIQMRAEELFYNSSLPPNMNAKGKDYTDGKSRQKLYAERARRAGITTEHKFRPRINSDVPDFEDLHRQFMKDLMLRKDTKEATVCKPFNLRTDKILSKKGKLYQDILKDEQLLKENKWPFRKSKERQHLSLSGSLSTSLDSIPTKMTKAAQLRTSYAKGRLQKEIDSEVSELEAERRRKRHEKQLKKFITEKAAANDQSSRLRLSTQDKLKEYRESERLRMQEYKKHLDEIRGRVEQRPLLLERQIQMNAKKTAEKKYRDRLRNAGLDEEFVRKKGSLAGSVRDDYPSDSDGGSISPQQRSVSDSRDYTNEFHEESGNESEASEIEDEVIEDNSEGEEEED